MADITASDVNYTVKINKRGFLGPRGWIQRAQISFGDASLTYPAGGIPLSKAKLGFKHNLDSLIIVEESAGDGLVYKFDKSAATIRIYYPTNQTGTPGDRGGEELASGSDAPAATVLETEAIGN